jgi:hypothetical protein
MVYNGLFDPKKGLVSKNNDDELAAVLGHEIAHATARHVSESLSRNFTIMAVGQIALSAIAASGTGTLQNAFNRVLVEGINLYVPFYSRGNEAEADKIGIMYMAKADTIPRPPWIYGIELVKLRAILPVSMHLTPAIARGQKIWKRFSRRHSKNIKRPNKPIPHA